MAVVSLHLKSSPEVMCQVNELDAGNFSDATRRRRFARMLERSASLVTQPWQGMSVNVTLGTPEERFLRSIVSQNSRIQFASLPPFAKPPSLSRKRKQPPSQPRRVIKCPCCSANIDCLDGVPSVHAMSRESQLEAHRLRCKNPLPTTNTTCAQLPPDTKEDEIEVDVEKKKQPASSG